MHFLKIDYEKTVLEYYKNPEFFYSQSISKPTGCKAGQEHLDLRNWQINQPLFKTTSRWKCDMKNIEKDTLKRTAQKELETLDYEKNRNW